jgi:hypothetical protein
VRTRCELLTPASALHGGALRCSCHTPNAHGGHFLVHPHRVQCRHPAPCGSTTPHEASIHRHAPAVHHSSLPRTGHPPLHASEQEMAEKVPSCGSRRSELHLLLRVGLTMEALRYVLQRARALEAVAACSAPAAHSFLPCLPSCQQMLVRMPVRHSTDHTARTRRAPSQAFIDSQYRLAALPLCRVVCSPLVLVHLLRAQQSAGCCMLGRYT